MDEEQLGNFLGSNHAEALQDLSCEDCAQEHGGKCPHIEDDDCVLDFSLVPWLHWLCKNPERLRRVMFERR